MLLALEAVRGIGSTMQAGTRGGRIDAQQQRAVGGQPAGGEGIQRGDGIDTEAAAGALVGERGVDEAVEQHPAAAVQQRQQRLMHELRTRGRVDKRLGARVDALREPGGVALAERLRAVVKDPALRVDARAEALVYAAARAQLVHELLLPLLSSGSWVLLDRFVDSSLAYQGGGRGLGVEEIAELNRFAVAGLVPDRTLYLRLDPAIGRSRQRGRGEEPDRLEQESEDFFAEIALTYEQLAASEPERIRVIDAEQGPPAVLADAIAAISDLL